MVIVLAHSVTYGAWLLLECWRRVVIAFSNGAWAVFIVQELVWCAEKGIFCLRGAAQCPNVHLSMPTAACRGRAQPSARLWESEGKCAVLSITAKALFAIAPYTA